MKRPRVVVVTGASAGVGRAAARAFANAGADVALLARNEQSLQAARREIEATGRRALVLPLDVADASAVAAAAAQTESVLGPIDVWVNNAMVTVVSPVAELSADEVRRVTEVTYLGTVHGTLAALQHMLPRNRGSIVQVGSALAYRAIPLQAPYCGAKFAIRGFTDALRTELLHAGSRVHVTMVQMPALNTPQFEWCRTRMPHEPQPVPPIFAPEVAARAIVFAASHRRREVFVGGSTVLAIWGTKLAPRWLDRYLGRTGFASQQTAEPVAEGRPENLWTSPPGDHGAHGRFSDRASRSSVALWWSMNRNWILSAAAGLTAGALFARSGRRHAR
jgi:short-subunit dehydrogenase